MLHEFLVANREKILAGAENGLPQFFDHLVQELALASHRKPIGDGLDPTDPGTRHGQEMRKLGYSVSQVVQGYGDLSRSINSLARVEKSPIGVKEFEEFGIVIDKAVAEAVGGFTRRRAESTECAQKIGVLAHELRNALAAATIAHSMLELGVVGGGGSTTTIIGRNLDRMREILDRSFSEVRMESESKAVLRRVALLDIAEEVEATASQDARSRGLTLRVAVDPELHVDADPHYLISALSNLVQNALKYSKRDGIIQVRSLDQGDAACLEVEDHCGGLPAGKAEDLFKPFTQKSADRTGLGLGLTISRKAVTMIGGSLSVRDLPDRGCVFRITLPKAGTGKPALG